MWRLVTEAHPVVCNRMITRAFSHGKSVVNGDIEKVVVSRGRRRPKLSLPKIESKPRQFQGLSALGNLEDEEDDEEGDSPILSEELKNVKMQAEKMLPSRRIAMFEILKAGDMKVKPAISESEERAADRKFQALLRACMGEKEPTIHTLTPNTDRRGRPVRTAGSGIAAEENPDDDFTNITNDGNLSEKERKVTAAWSGLLNAAGLPWRETYSSRQLPDWLLDHIQDIIGERRPSEMRRLAKRWVLQGDRDGSEDYEMRPIGWSQAPTKPVAQRNMDADDVKAVTYYWLPPRFTILRRILSEAERLMARKGNDTRGLAVDWAPRRVLDLSGGAGESLAAVWTKFNKSLETVHIVQANEHLRTANERIIREEKITSAKVFTRTSDLLTQALSSPKSGKTGNPVSKKYDLVMLPYSLSDLPSDEARARFLQVAYELTEPGGTIVITESGQARGSYHTRWARQFLLSMSRSIQPNGSFSVKMPKLEVSGEPSIRNGQQETIKYDGNLIIADPEIHSVKGSAALNVLAPCTHDGFCPLAPGARCSFQQKSVSKKIQMDLLENFSYTIIHKPNPNGPVLPWLEDSKDSAFKPGEFASVSSNVLVSKLNRLSQYSPHELAIGHLERRTHKQDEDNEEDALLIEDIVLNAMEKDSYRGPPLRRSEFFRVMRQPLVQPTTVSVLQCNPWGAINTQRYTRETHGAIKDVMASASLGALVANSTKRSPFKSFPPRRTR